MKEKEHSHPETKIRLDSKQAARNGQGWKVMVLGAKKRRPYGQELTAHTAWHIQCQAKRVQ